MPADWRNVGRATATGVATFAVFTLVGGGAYADPPGEDPPNFLMTWDASNDGIPASTYNWEDFGKVGPGDNPGDWNYTGELFGPNELWHISWDTSFNADPFVTANIVVTNNDPSPQTFSLLMTLPISDPIADTLMGGSAAGTLTDNFGDGAQINTADDTAIYTAMIDGSGVQTLFDPGFEFNVGPFESEPFGPQDFGLPGPSMPGPPVDETIGIRLQFELSGFDSASMTSIFEVIPGPGGLAVLAIFGVAGRRRRRS